MTYSELNFKIPQESPSYKEDSYFVIKNILAILEERKKKGDDKIIINTNLRKGLPLENINKIAGPMIEAWAGEVFEGIRDSDDNIYSLINVETQHRLEMADIILQFKKRKRHIDWQCRCQGDLLRYSRKREKSKHHVFLKNQNRVCAGP